MFKVLWDTTTDAVVPPFISFAFSLLHLSSLFQVDVLHWLLHQGLPWSTILWGCHNVLRIATCHSRCPLVASMILRHNLIFWRGLSNSQGTWRGAALTMTRTAMSNSNLRHRRPIPLCLWHHITLLWRDRPLLIVGSRRVLLRLHIRRRSLSFFSLKQLFLNTVTLVMCLLLLFAVHFGVLRHHMMVSIAISTNLYRVLTRAITIIRTNLSMILASRLLSIITSLSRTH